jgi:hypothetical protein
MDDAVLIGATFTRPQHRFYVARRDGLSALHARFAALESGIALTRRDLVEKVGHDSSLRVGY